MATSLDPGHLISSTQQLRLGCCDFIPVALPGTWSSGPDRWNCGRCRGTGRQRTRGRDCAPLRSHPDSMIKERQETQLTLIMSCFWDSSLNSVPIVHSVQFWICRNVLGFILTIGTVMVQETKILKLHCKSKCKECFQ
uniref:Uncharacterized protein n=1 Tax=Esox lucius TaxID=8010 RepID=A0AAY5JXV0_ESOLU